MNKRINSIVIRFGFFWWGWLRRLTEWLPHSKELWQELLLLRELRADQWAAQQVDPLVLAESLLLMVNPYPAEFRREYLCRHADSKRAIDYQNG